jgi:hypothetical protein
VQDDAGRVDDRLERRPKQSPSRARPPLPSGRDRRRFVSERVAAAIARRASAAPRAGRRRRIGAEARLERAHRRALAHLLDRRNEDGNRPSGDSTEMPGRKLQLQSEIALVFEHQRLYQAIRGVRVLC